MKSRLCSWKNTEENRRREGAWQTSSRWAKVASCTLASVANGHVIPGGQAWLMWRADIDAESSLPLLQPTMQKKKTNRRGEESTVREDTVTWGKGLRVCTPWHTCHRSPAPPESLHPGTRHFSPDLQWGSR